LASKFGRFPDDLVYIQQNLFASTLKLCRGCCWGGETTPTTPPIT